MSQIHAIVWLGAETLDHPSEGELLAFARKYFKRVDELGRR
jgi:hypothetical protein